MKGSSIPNRTMSGSSGVAAMGGMVVVVDEVVDGVVVPRVVVVSVDDKKEDEDMRNLPCRINPTRNKRKHTMTIQSFRRMERYFFVMIFGSIINSVGGGFVCLLDSILLLPFN